MLNLKWFDTLSMRFSVWLERQAVWTNVYGLARTVLAMGTLLTLLLNNTDILFKEGVGAISRVYCGSYSQFGLYCLVPEDRLELARWLAILILAIAASGWRPMITALPHFFVSFSLHASSPMVDGGEQVTTVLTLLLLPIALTDARRWHWISEDKPSNRLTGSVFKLIALSSLAAIRLQVAVIYLQAAVAKFKVAEWVDGTAMYYWLNSPYVGLPSFLRPLFEPLLTSGVVALMTWSALALELSLGSALLMDNRYKKWLFSIGLFFHVAIAVLMGISSFSIAMTAALILYLRNPRDAFVSPGFLNVLLAKRFRLPLKGSRGKVSVPPEMQVK